MSLEIRFPETNQTAAQDEEYCEVVLGEEVRRIRFHDYGEIFEVPGLYEQLFYGELGCTSPTVVTDLLQQTLETSGVSPDELRVLDLGAGNGMVAEELARMGVAEFVGVDIIPQAATAAERDRPGLYDDYVVADMTRLSEADRRTLAEQRFTCLTSVAALGFGDVPPEAFATAYDLLEDDGFVAFCIKEDFLDDGERSGFATLIGEMLEDGELDVVSRRRYTHRQSAAGEELPYVALVARKAGGEAMDESIGESASALT
jgi:predicted TPR repeat methyltransferase